MKTLATICLLFGSLSAFAQPSNDNRANAVNLTDITSWSSSNAAYTTVAATPDDFGGAPYSDYKNVWFKFEADGSEIDIRVLTGSSKGTIQQVTIRLYDDSGTLVKQLPTHTNTTYSIVATNLVDNNTYYFSVDSYPTSGFEGTFSLEMNNAVTYDSRLKAQVLTDLSFSSSPAAYTTANATPDDFSGAPWYNKNNVWFKFQATTTEIDIRILVGSSNGTLQNPEITFFNNSGTQIGRHPSSTNIAFVQNISLTIGDWYYFFVDSPTGPGTFSMVINDAVDFDLRAKAMTLSDISDWASANSAFTNVNATSDDFEGAPWYNYKSVWFKFQATTSQISIDVLTGGSYGTLQNINVKLYSATGTQIATQGMSGTISAYLRLSALTPGDWYYFYVDTNPYSPGDGTFSLKVNDDLGYDFKSGALTLDHLPTWCSADSFFDNSTATADETNGSSCYSTFTRNVWFKFKATTSSATIRLQHGGVKGSMATGNMVLISQSNSFLACDADEIVTTTLTKGSWYYLVVDSGTGGTFTLCLEGGAGGSLCENIYCDEDGVGINTPFVPAGYTLAVKGKIIAEGIKVQFESLWPDFVFDPNYKLSDLKQVKQFISDNNHLPGVPSAAEVKENGIDVGDMNAKLLQKIEEMTLYMIRMEERLDKLEKENQSLRSVPKSK